MRTRSASDLAPIFSHELAAMNFYGSLAGPDFRGDLFVRQTCDHPWHHLPSRGVSKSRRCLSFAVFASC